MRRRQANKIFKRYWLSRMPFSHFRWKKRTFSAAINFADFQRLLVRFKNKRQVSK